MKNTLSIMTLVPVLFFAVSVMAQTPKVVVIPLGNKIDHCDGNPYGGSIPDGCGVCGGTAFTCAGCDGVPNSGVTLGCNGVCGGEKTTCSIKSYRGDTVFALWQRPSSFGNGTSESCGLSSVANGVNYSVQKFSVTTTGSYTIDAAWDAFDGYLFLYRTSFNANDQCLNLIAMNDDLNYAPYFSRMAGITLTAGVQYSIVSTGFNNFQYGNFNNTIRGPLGSTITLLAP